MSRPYPANDLNIDAYDNADGTAFAGCYAGIVLGCLACGEDTLKPFVSASYRDRTEFLECRECGETLAIWRQS